MAELPILPIATDAILADTTHMSAEEFGAYMRLLLVMWRHGASLPDNDTKLANIAGVPPKRWAAIRETVMLPMLAKDGTVTQKKLTETWDKVQKLRVKRISASNKRWSSKYRPQAMHMHNQVQSTSNAIPKPNRDSSSGTKSEKDDAPEGLCNDELVKPPHAVSGSELAAMYAKKNTRAH